MPRLQQKLDGLASRNPKCGTQSQCTRLHKLHCAKRVQMRMEAYNELAELGRPCFRRGAFNRVTPVRLRVPGRSPCQRQCYRDRGAFIHCAFDADIPPMRFGDRFDNRQPKPSSS